MQIANSLTLDPPMGRGWGWGRVCGGVVVGLVFGVWGDGGGVLVDGGVVVGYGMAGCGWLGRVWLGVGLLFLVAAGVLGRG